MKSYSSDMFKELREGLNQSLVKVEETITNSLNKTKSEMQQFVEQMKAIAKSASFDMPQIDNETPVENLKQRAPDNVSSRGPPSTKIKMPTIDLSNNRQLINIQMQDARNQISITNEMIEAQKQKLKQLEQEYLNVDTAIGERNELRESLLAQKEYIQSLKKELATFDKVKPEIRIKNLDRIENLKQQLDEATQEAKELEIELNRLEKSNLDKKASQINEQMSRLKFSMSQNSTKSKILQTQLDSQSKSTSKLSRLSNFAKNNLSKMGRGASNLGKNVVNATSNLLKFTLGIRNSNNASKGYSHSIGGLIRSFTIFSLIFPLVSRGIMALGSNISATLQTNQQFSNSLNQIKSNLQTAFTPIFQAIMPALNALMAGLAKVTAYISAFVSAIFGKSLSQTKKATAGINAAKDALENTGKSASGTSKKIKEATRALMGFDEINKLDKQDDSSGSSGTSGGSVYTPSNIDTGTVSQFAKKLRDMWKKGDYSGVGKAIGEQINKAVLSFTDFISWNRIGGKITSFLNAFCTLFNSLIHTINWQNIGKMFGEGINTITNTLYILLNGIDWQHLGKGLANGLNGLVHKVDWNKFGSTIGSYFQASINALYGFVTTADWPAIGKGIADGIMGLTNKIDWSKLGATLSTGIRGLFKTIQTAIANLNWKQLGKDLWNFISNIDWSGMIRDVAYLIGQSIAGIGTFLWGFIEDSVKSIGEYWARQFKECGGDVVAGLLKGILEAIAGIASWIKTNIFDPFINGFKSIFGIHSPSTVMIEMGKYLIQGLVNGIKAIPILGTVIDVVGKGINWIGEQYSDLKQKGTKLFENLKEGIKNNPIVQTVSSKVSDGLNWIGTQYNNFKSKGKSLFDYVKSGIANNPIVSTVSSLINNGIKTIQNKNNDFKNKGKDSMNNLKSGISANSKYVTDQASNVANSIASKINNGAVKKASSWGSDMMSGLASGIRGATKWVTSAVSNVASKISSWLHFTRPDVGPLRNYETWMPDFMDGMTRTLENSKPKLLNMVSSIATDISESINMLQEPEIAFAGSRDITVSHIFENSNDEDVDLKKAILDELKNFKEYFEMLKETIDNKDSDTYIDSEVMYRKFVEKHNQKARRKGKSDLDI